LVDSLIPEYGGNLFNIDDIRAQVTVDLTDVRDAKAMTTLIKKARLSFQSRRPNQPPGFDDRSAD
jgi:hypothetical protein